MVEKFPVSLGNPCLDPNVSLTTAGAFGAEVAHASVQPCEGSRDSIAERGDQRLDHSGLALAEHQPVCRQDAQD